MRRCRNETPRAATKRKQSFLRKRKRNATLRKQDKGLKNLRKLNAYFGRGRQDQGATTWWILFQASDIFRIGRCSSLHQQYLHSCLPSTYLPSKQPWRVVIDIDSFGKFLNSYLYFLRFNKCKCLQCFFRMEQILVN